jgi:protein-S-isoprenylcysteine O-methyltransferase Ste14
MSSLRYYLALALVVSFPPAILFWLVIHPLVHFWRKLGPTWTYAIVGTPMLLAMFGMFLARATLLAMEFGTRYALAALGVLCLVGAGRLRLLIREQASLWLISGLPELAPDRQASGLLSEGIYARIRHPRYVQIALALLGWTLVARAGPWSRTTWPPTWCWRCGWPRSTRSWRSKRESCANASGRRTRCTLAAFPGSCRASAARADFEAGRASC